MYTWFEAYELMQKNCKDEPLINGRYGQQRYSESFIVTDVIDKLDLCISDVLLDIGCGSGSLLMACSLVCDRVYGNDNEAAINNIKTRYVPSNVFLIPGNWFDTDLGHFKDVNKISIYSVVHYLRDIETFFSFVDKALSILDEDGRILIGDIPNIDKKNRFLNTRFGREFDKRFKEETKSIDSEDGMKADALWKSVHQKGLEETIIFTDCVIEKIIRHYHRMSCDVHILPQPSYLPFGHTREDILIVRR